VKSPKGFGKKYFTFASILAHSIHNKIQAVTVKTTYLLNKFSENEEQEDTDPPTELLVLLCIINKKPCHCNCVFKFKSRLTLKIHHFIPRCAY
jgi:hypothetical protein